MNYFIDRTTNSELTEAQFRRATRERASLGDVILPEVADALGYDLINQLDEPLHDTSRKKAVPGDLVPVGKAAFERGWVVVDLTPAEIDAKAAEYALQLELLRNKKMSDINSARAQADGSYFEFGGKQIDADADSMRQINAITGYVALFNAFPPGFPGAWKTMDNSYLPLPDIATWKALVQSMAVTGTSNFLKQQALKTDVAQAASMAAIESIQW